MILLLIAILAVSGLAFLYKTNSRNKIPYMAYIVIVLVLVNFINELANSIRYYNSFDELKDRKRYTFLDELHVDFETTLLSEELLVIDHLQQKMKVNEHGIIFVRNLHPERLRHILSEYMKQHSNVRLLQLNHKDDGQIDPFGMRYAVERSPKKFHYLFLDGYFTFDQLTVLKSLYETTSISIIFRSLPEAFLRHSISHYTEIVEIPENYFMGLLQRSYPANLLALCTKYVPLNYGFYVKSQNQPLAQLCCGGLPTTAVTECIRDFMKDQNDNVPLTKVKHCLERGTTEGLQLNNGMVRVKKQYYWHSKCNVQDFIKQRHDSGL